MKIKNGPPHPPPSSVRGHERVRRGPAPLSSPWQEGPRRESTPPSPAIETSRYDTTQQRGGPVVPSKAPTQQEQAAYTTRTSSLRYGQRPAAYRAPDSAPPQGGYSLNEAFASMDVSSANPGWRVSRSRRADIDSVLLDRTNKPIPGAHLTQYIAQDESAEFRNLPGAGACSAITTRWFKEGMRASGPERASEKFNQQVQDPHALATRQEDYLRKHQKVTALRDDLSAKIQNKTRAEQELHERKADFDGFAQEARDEYLHPDDKWAYHQLEKEKRSVPRGSRRYQDIVREQADLTQHAIDLALPDAESKQHFLQVQTEFADVRKEVTQLHNEIEALRQAIPIAQEAVEKHENAGMEKVWSSPHTMRSSADFGNTVTAETSATGFYRISLRGEERSHAMGIQNLGNGQFKFMDPNSGEFHLHGEAALKHVVTQNASRMGYERDAHSFEIQHLMP
ncbi:MAG: hypothetical protein ABW123_13865 [Cystobacter sp.]